MIAGHFGFAAGVKSKATTVPLWALMLASSWLDVVYAFMLVIGGETVEMVQGMPENSYGGVIFHADYTHSLLGAALLSALFGSVAALRYGRTRGLILGLVSASHWFLDLITHRSDLTLLPGDTDTQMKFGFGLFRYPMYSAALEMALVIFGALFYWLVARKVAKSVPGAPARANICAISMVVAGALMISLNFFGY